MIYKTSLISKRRFFISSTILLLILSCVSVSSLYFTSRNASKTSTVLALKKEEEIIPLKVDGYVKGAVVERIKIISPIIGANYISEVPFKVKVSEDLPLNNIELYKEGEETPIKNLTKEELSTNIKLPVGSHSLSFLADIEGEKEKYSSHKINFTIVPEPTKTPAPTPSSTPIPTKKPTPLPTKIPLKDVNKVVTSPIPVSGITYDTVKASQLISLVNNERSKRGLTVLKENSLLNKAATLHATNMSTYDFFSHWGKDGKNSKQRIIDAGYTPHIMTIENIAYGHDTPLKVFTAWMNSSIHRTQMLDPDLRDIAIAHAYNPKVNIKPVWVLNAGAR